MTNNLYMILGVERDATPEEIKKAYRALSKIHHPDVGGDPEEFRKLQEAYDCLMDDAKRKRYDEFGFIPGGEEERHALVVINTLCMVFDSIAESVTPEQMEKYDLIGIMQKAIKEKIRVHEQFCIAINMRLKKNEKLQSVLEARLKRKATKPSPNFFLATIEKRIKVIQEELGGAEYQLRVAKDMEVAINEYDFTFDPEDNRFQQQSFYTMDGRGNILNGLIGGLGGRK